MLHDDLVLRSGGDIAWAFRKDSPQLAASLVSFTKATAKGTEFGNVVANRYLVAAEQLRTSDSADRKRFLELLALFEKWGGRYRFDPLLLAAQGYQESGLDQKRRSPSGAVGIMQIRPATAQDPTVGVTRIDRLENNVEAGAKYLRHLIDDTSPTRTSPSSTACSWRWPPTTQAPAGSATCVGARPGAASTPTAGSARSSCRPSATWAGRRWPMSATS